MDNLFTAYMDYLRFQNKEKEKKAHYEEYITAKVEEIFKGKNYASEIGGAIEECLKQARHN